MKHHLTATESGSAGTWVLLALGLVLLAGGALLWLVLGTRETPDDDHEEPAQQHAEPPPEPAHARPRLTVRHGEPGPGRPGGSMLKSSQRAHQLVGQTRQGLKNAQARADKGKHLKVTVAGPPTADGMNADIWLSTRGLLPQLTRCYQARLVDRPGLAGRLMLALSTRADGEHAGFHAELTRGSTIRDFKLQQCILQRLQAARLPLPLADVKDQVVYPLTLRPGAAPAPAGKTESAPP